MKDNSKKIQYPSKVNFIKEKKRSRDNKGEKPHERNTEMKEICPQLKTHKISARTISVSTKQD